MNGITVHKDEHGVTREYREVKRKAQVGELVYSKFNEGTVGKVLKVEDGYVVISVGQGEIGVWEDSYVVLLPTDIIHYNGKRYREVSREGQVGDLVLFKEQLWYVHDIYNGTFEREMRLSHVKDGYYTWVGTFSGRVTVLEPVDYFKDIARPSVDSRITALEQRVAELEAKLLEQRVDRVTEHPESTVKWRDVRRTAITADDVSEMAQVKREKEMEERNQLTRAEVIDMAKRDVEDLIKDKKYIFDIRENRNGEIRWVCAIVILRDEPYKIHCSGYARCRSDDTFNKWIGAAIALRRALGLDVPDYYVNAPEPTEAQVGDVVEWVHFNHRYVITGRDGCTYDFVNVETGRSVCAEYQPPLVHDGDSFTILDDSHDFGGKGDQFGA